jgi:hypothetical protein
LALAFFAPQALGSAVASAAATSSGATCNQPSAGGSDAVVFGHFCTMLFSKTAAFSAAIIAGRSGRALLRTGCKTTRFLRSGECDAIRHNRYNQPARVLFATR